jgi:hypothetical protein
VTEQIERAVETRRIKDNPPLEERLRMTRTSLAAVVATAGLALAGAQVAAQNAGAGQTYPVGNALGLPMTPADDGSFNPISPNVKVYGSVYSAESCSYDPVRDLIVIPNRGVGQNVQVNNAWITFMNHDGSIHTSRWLGIQGPEQRASLDPPLVLNEPFGSDIADGVLYLADRDGGTSANDPSVAVIRRFDMATGRPLGESRIESVAWFNDIEVAADGTVFATVTGAAGENADPNTWQLWRVPQNGEAEILVQGPPLARPNGVAIDGDGNVVVVNMGTPDVVTFTPDGEVVRTEQAAQAGNDGIVIMADGTKYVSSVLEGGVSRIRPGQPAELMAENIPNAASMCYDEGANQLVIPMNANNAVAFISLD